MSDHNDPDLQALFDQQPVVQNSEAFVADVIAAAGRRRMHWLAWRAAIVAGLILLELVFESPISHSLGVLGSAMKTPVISLQDDWAAFLIEPINSVAGVLGLVLLGVHVLLRRYIR
ncbi:MAG: hypothetical protein AAF290_03265 [Pseudomonadota bacterium]